MAEEGQENATATSSAEGASQDGDRSGVVTVAAAVVTGLGTLGWVTFIGGAILWISFAEAHLPPAEAVAKVPTSVLIATGAEFVVAAVAAALAGGTRISSIRCSRGTLARDGLADARCHVLQGV